MELSSYPHAPPVRQRRPPLGINTSHRPPADRVQQLRLAGVSPISSDRPCVHRRRIMRSPLARFGTRLQHNSVVTGGQVSVPPPHTTRLRRVAGGGNPSLPKRTREKRQRHTGIRRRAEHTSVVACRKGWTCQRSEGRRTVATDDTRITRVGAAPLERRPSLTARR